MSTYAFLILCVQACLVQNVYSQCLRGPEPIGTGFVGGYGAGYGGYGAGYGGTGVGDVGVVGELPVTGTTAVAGQVPIMGAVQFRGCVAAGGTVTITGSCGCDCRGGYRY